MKPIPQDILSRNRDVDQRVVIVNPVSWVPMAKTVFNGRVEDTFPKVAENVKDCWLIFDRNVRGHVDLTSCLDTHGYVVASIFCVGMRGISVEHLRDGLRQLAAWLPDATYRIPVDMGLGHLDKDAAAYAEATIDHILRYNDIEVNAWYWEQRRLPAPALMASDEFQTLKNLWSDPDLLTNVAQRSDWKRLHTCMELWTAFCVHYRLMPADDAYQACLDVLYTHHPGVDQSFVPHDRKGRGYATMGEFMAAYLPDDYDGIPIYANGMTDNNYLFHFIDQVNTDGIHSASIAEYLIRSLVTSYLHAHGLHNPEETAPSFVKAIHDHIRARDGLWGTWVSKLFAYAPKA